MLKIEIVKEIKNQIEKVYLLEEEHKEIVRIYNSITSSLIVPEFELYRYGNHMDCFRGFYRIKNMSEAKLMRMRKAELMHSLCFINEVVERITKQVKSLLWNEQRHIELMIKGMDKIETTTEKIETISAITCSSEMCGKRYDLVAVGTKSGKTCICKKENYDSGIKTGKVAGFVGDYIEVLSETYYLAGMNYARETLLNKKIFENLTIEQIDAICEKVKNLEL